MFHLESDPKKTAVDAAEQILHDASVFNEENVVAAAEAIINAPAPESRMLDVGLTPEMVEFLSSIFSEQSQADSELNQIPKEEAGDVPANMQEGITATLSAKFDTLNQLAERFPGQTQLSIREIQLIRSHLAELMASLKQQDNRAQLKLFDKIAKSIDKVFIRAETSADRNSPLEGVVEFTHTNQ